MARISIPTRSYNERRDGKPWICRVNAWPVGKHPEIAWGSFAGSPGDAGELVVEAAPGDVIRWGQKDLRGGSHTYSQYGVIEADGSARDVTDAEAATYYQVDRNSMTPPDHAATLADIPTEALEAEIARRRGLENYMTPEEK